MKTLDLHGYKTDEVEPAVDQFLHSLSGVKDKQAKILTGKGTGAVKAVVVAYLKKAHYPWQFEKLKNGKPNEGSLIVFLN